MFPVLPQTLVLASIVVIVQVASENAGAGSDSILQESYDFVIGL